MSYTTPGHLSLVTRQTITVSCAGRNQKVVAKPLPSIRWKVELAAVVFFARQFTLSNSYSPSLVMESIYELARETCLGRTPLPSYFNIKMENFLFHTNLIRIFIYIIRMELFQKLKITNPRIKTRTPSWNREFRNYCLDCTPLPSYFNIKIENFLFHTNFIRIFIYIIRRMELFQKLNITNPRIKTRTPSWNGEFRNYCLFRPISISRWRISYFIQISYVSSYI